MSNRQTLLQRKRLLDKAAVLVWRLNHHAVSLRLRKDRDETIKRIGYMAVAEELRFAFSTQENQQ